jgi:CHAD domain-containing protein
VSSINRKLLLRLQVKRGLLLRHYDDEALHQLRVAIRRLRSRLRHVDSSEARALCHDLGELAHVTNAARDWDTLLRRARDSLKPKAFRRLQPWLQDNRLASHLPVLEMLRSSEWSDTIQKLDAWIERDTSRSDGQAGEKIACAKHDVRRAWEKLEAEDDRKQWHKLRIAIKELRYALDSVPQAAEEPPDAKALQHCKRLQQMLGAWHDTVVHLQMVRELADSLDPDVESRRHEILQAWRKRMEREAEVTLDDARGFLAGKGADLLQSR